MRCEQVQDILPLYVGKDVSGEHKKLVEEHLGACSDCKQELKEYAEPLAVLTAMKEEPVPDRVWQEMWAGIQSELRFSRKESRLLFFDHLMKAAAVLIIGVGVGFFGYLAGGRSGAIQTPGPVADHQRAVEKSIPLMAEKPVREIVAEVGEHVVVKVTTYPDGDGASQPVVFKAHAQNLAEFKKKYTALYDECSYMFSQGSGRFINISDDQKTVTLVTSETPQDKGSQKSIGLQFRPANIPEFVGSCGEWVERGQGRQWGNGRQRTPQPEGIPQKK